MIPFFPEPYPDELLYSLLARYYVKSGYLSFAYAVEDLYVHPYTRPDIEFINELRPEVLKLLSRKCSLETLIQNNTMFPSYGRFLPGERKREAYNALLEMHGNFNNLLSLPKNQRGNGRFLRYCPVCAGEDRKRYGQAYWHRGAQIQGIEICVKHGCCLKESAVSMNRKATPGLWDAESIIPEWEEVVLCEDKRMQETARYANRVFYADMDFANKVQAADLLKAYLGRYRRTDSGASISLENLYRDYRAFYKEQAAMTKLQIQKTLNGVRWDFWGICQLGMFAGVPVEELVRIPDISEKIRSPVFQQVSEELGVEYGLVQKIGDAVLRCYEGREQVQRRRRNDVWERMDKELLPEVKKTIQYLKGDGIVRPQRVTVSSVTRAMGFPDKRFEKLPGCRRMILDNQVSQEEYWAEETVWAYRKLIREGEEVTWSRIRRLINIRKVDFQKCRPFLQKYADKTEETCICRVI